jgi:hypothetical protein
MRFLSLKKPKASPGAMTRLPASNDNRPWNKKNYIKSLIGYHSIIIAGLNGNAVADFECSLDSADVT